MPHSSEQTWGVFSNKVAGVADSVLSALLNAEENYQDMLETYTWAGSTDTRFANLLFAGDPDLTTATAEEISKATDLKDAMTAVHQLYQAMTNVPVTTSDRAAKLRRMS